MVGAANKTLEGHVAWGVEREIFWAFIQTKF
jgi:hypothetical protein